MSKSTTEASWIGRAAHEIIRATGRTGKEANRLARQIAAELSDYGADFARVDPRAYALDPSGLRAATVLLDLDAPSAAALERRNRMSDFLP